MLEDYDPIDRLRENWRAVCGESRTHGSEGRTVKPTLAIGQGARSLPYHEYRERWIADSWQWYDNYLPEKRQNDVPKDEALSQIKERESYVRANATPPDQSKRAQLYELVADLTDEDGALTELEDFENLGWLFLGDPETDDDQ